MSSDTNRQPVNLREDQITLSEPRLRISFQSMYECGRRSVNCRSFSVSQALSGAFVAELITTIVYICTGDTLQLLQAGTVDTPLSVHTLITVVLGTVTALAFSMRNFGHDLDPSDTEIRDQAVQQEIDALFEHADSNCNN